VIVSLDIPGCVGNTWVGNNFTVDFAQLAPAAHLSPSLSFTAILAIAFSAVALVSLV
jgi:hypothetical protein